MKIAIPTYQNSVAPCFEATRQFEIISLHGKAVDARHTVLCEGSEGYRRIRLLRIHNVERVLCNGIKRLYCDILTASGIEVYHQLIGTVDQMLTACMGDQLQAFRYEPDPDQPAATVSRDKLVDWARELFRCAGYKVEDGPDPDAVLIDLVADIECPRCGKAIKVAICVAPHTYRVEQDIQEFHRMTANSYNARILVYPGDRRVETNCREYGIEMINPEKTRSLSLNHAVTSFPILNLPVRDHELAAETEETIDEPE